MDLFGAGVLFATPLNDALGNTIALPSPVQFGIVQDVSIDDSSDVKELYGANQYPVDIGRGKAKLMIKCKMAQINAELFNSIYYGQTLTSGWDGVLADAVGTMATAAVAVTPTAPYGGTSTFVADLGVQDGAGNPYTRVASSPTVGQYSLSGDTYSFSPIDAAAGKIVFISYQYANSTNPAAGKLLTINNVPMGQVPVFSAQFFNSRSGKGAMWRKFPQCVATKLSMDFKNDDFVIPDLEISCFVDANNIAQQFAFTS